MPTLYVVATPIGNLSDMTPRAVEALRECALIAAEDTRVTRKLLAHFDIHTPLVSYHQHNERERAQALVERMLKEDLDIALTCDAGTPAISDPGSVLTDLAWKSGIRVVPVCGPSAVAAAVSACGFDVRTFAFAGFLPREKKGLGEEVARMAKSGVPVWVAYESPHRIVKLFEELKELLPWAQAAVCCDISKFYEKIRRGTTGELYQALKDDPKVQKGEYCVVLNLAQAPQPQKEEAEGQKEMPEELLLCAQLLSGMPLQDAQAHLLTMGRPRNQVYRAKLRVKEMLSRLLEEGE